MTTEFVSSALVLVAYMIGFAHSAFILKDNR